MKYSRRRLNSEEYLTKGEVLALVRRRLDISQHELAALMGVSRGRVSDIENDVVLIKHAWAFNLRLQSPITTAEKCWIYRRRAGVTQLEVSRSMGVSRTIVNQMERGLRNPSDLVFYWEA